MPPTQGYISTAAVLLFALACTTVAHGNEKVPESMNFAEDVRPAVFNTTSAMEPESYSQLGAHTGVMIAHIAFMTIAWVFVLPIGV